MISIQSLLKDLGYDPGPLDGIEGPKTRAAVRAFQRTHDLRADGIVGPRTRDALLRAQARVAGPTTSHAFAEDSPASPPSVEGSEPSLRNYAGANLTLEQVRAFRRRVQMSSMEALAGGVREWNTELLTITEGRRSLFKNGKRTFFYSWCGDWVSYHLMRAGCRHGLALNREALNGHWEPGMNLALLQAWAGDPAISALPRFKHRFAEDASAGKSWHTWDNEKDRCSDGYEPELCDLVLLERKGGGHIEFFLCLDDESMTVSAGAQSGGVAAERERDLKLTNIRGIINIARLAAPIIEKRNPAIVTDRSTGAADGDLRRPERDLASETSSEPPVSEAPPNFRRIIDVQAELFAQGLYQGPIDGIYGPKSIAALKRFQELNGLTADGIIGPQTRSMLEEARAARLSGSELGSI